MPGVPDAVLMEGLIERLSLRLDLTPPTNLHIAASYQQIKDIQNADLDCAGMLTPSPDGSFTIMVRASDRSHRKNFTIGHEISHTFLPGYTVVQRRCGTTDRSTPSTISRRLESLADVGAAELLLPRRYLTPLFADTPFSMTALKGVADTHHASLDATLRQFLHLTDRQGIVLDIRQATRRDGSAEVAIHRIFSNTAWCAVAPSQLTGMPLADSHPLCAVFDHGQVDDVLDLSFLLTATSTADVSALIDPYTDHKGNRVMRSLVLATPRLHQLHPTAVPGSRINALLAAG